MYLIIDIEEDYFKIIENAVKHGDDYKPLVLIANGKPVMKLEKSTVDYLKARRGKEAEKLKEAIQLTECISIDYEDRSKEEIEKLDDALDLIFGCARERLKELKKEAKDENT